MQVWALLGMLGGCSWKDYRRQRVLVCPVLLFGIMGVFCHIFFQEQSIYSLMAGSAIGILLLLLGVWTKQMGAGDGVIMMVTGIYLGFWDNVQLLLIGLTLSGLWSLCYVVRSKSITKRIAVIPFLFVGYIWMVLT